jgi:hypothetical protein
MFPSHIAWLCKYPELDRFDLSSVLSITVVGSLINPIYERQIFHRLPNILFLNNVTNSFIEKANKVVFN